MQKRSVALGLSLVPWILAVVACGDDAPPPNTPPVVSTAKVDPPKPVQPELAEATDGLKGADEASLDRSVQPCDDFYQFACGGWVKNTPIPGDEAGWFRGFSVLEEENKTLLKTLVESYAKGDTGGDASLKKVGDFYASCMDEPAIEKAGADPLKPWFAKIDRVQSLDALATTVSDLHSVGIPAFFDFDSEQDFKDATQVIGGIGQRGLGLPDRDYYLKDDDRTKKIRGEYEAHIVSMMQLLGDKPDAAKAKAKDVMEIETKLAQVSMSRVDMRDPQKIYHRMELAELEKLAPSFAWGKYFTATGVAKPPLNVAQPEFFKGMSDMLGKKPDWKKVHTYLRWHVARGAAPLLSTKFVDENFKMQKVLTGVEKLPPRWKRCVRAADQAVGMSLAQGFVKKTLGEDGKRLAKDMIMGIEAAQRENIASLSWMDQDTKTKAVEKLELIANKIGYPDKWRDYTALTIDAKSYAGNSARAAEFETKRQLAKIGKPVDRNEWLMTPPTVNAYYEPTMNEMVFPAGILRPPFFGAQMTTAINFGAIGMVMGHELTHGFDDEGRQFDGKGNLRDWWTKGSGEAFEKRAACVDAQYSDFVVHGEKVNGKLTMGENVADLGGLKLSFRAYQKGAASKPRTKTGGFTPEQQFFLGFAQGWCANVREESARLRIKTDPHSPPKYRVNGPVSNSADFAAAFQCKEGAPMARPAAVRCDVW